MVDSLGWVDAVAGSPEYTGRMLRQLNGVAFASATAARPLGARSGVRPGTSVTTVTATSTTWTCQPFAGLLDGQTAGEAGAYPFAFSASTNGAMNAADASNPRVDIIYVQVDDPSESDGSTVPAVTRKYLAGTAAATPSAPATPARSIAIARINVPKSGSGSPTVTWVAPYCAAAGGVVDFNTKAELDLWTTAPVRQKATVLAGGVEFVRLSGIWSPTLLRGEQSVAIPTANVDVITDIVFAYPFASVPVVTATPSSTIASVAVSMITTTGFRLTVQRSSTTSTVCQWIAVL